MKVPPPEVEAPPAAARRRSYPASPGPERYAAPAIIDPRAPVRPVPVPVTVPRPTSLLQRIKKRVSTEKGTETRERNRAARLAATNRQATLEAARLAEINRLEEHDKANAAAGAAFRRRVAEVARGSQPPPGARAHAQVPQDQAWRATPATPATPVTPATPSAPISLIRTATPPETTNTPPPRRRSTQPPAPVVAPPLRK